MVDRMLDTFLAEAGGSMVLAELSSQARRSLGLVLVVFVRRGREVVDVHPTGESALLPAFCRTIRRTPEGKKRCLACRSLISLGACYRGRTDYFCHGGVTILAAPSAGAGCKCTGLMAISAVAFRSGDAREGSRAATAYADGLGIAPKRIRKVYRQLPRLSEAEVDRARSIVTLAACSLGEIQRRISAAGPNDRAARPNGRQDMAAALAEMAGEPIGTADGERASILSELVAAMVSRAPGLPYSISDIARAVRITPNHLSMLFK